LQGGVPDAPFNNSGITNFFNIGVNLNAINSAVLQPDDKTIIGTQSGGYKNVDANRIVRINVDGTIDTTFTNLGVTSGGAIRSLALQSDGKVIAGGQFPFYDVQVNRIMRLNSDGTRDTTFTTNVGTAANNVVNSTAVQSDGKILIGGFFTTFNGATVNRIVRLNSNGTRDTTFTTNAGSGASNGTVNAIAIQSDGKIILGGTFTNFNGSTVNRIVRLNSDGTRDTAFITNTGTGFESTVSTIAIQPDGKILVGGFFTTFNGSSVNYLVRLNSNGTRDTAFTTNMGTGPSNVVQSVLYDSDAGIIFIGGGFSAFNGVLANGLARLSSAGVLNTTFATNIGSGLDNPDIFFIVKQPNGNILAGGNFYSFNNYRSQGLLRISTTGIFSPIPYFDGDVQKIAIQPDGKILVGGDFFRFSGVLVNRIARLFPDGTIDNSFSTGSGFNESVRAIKVQPDGKILIGGFFTTFNGATVNRIVRLNSNGTRDTSFTTNTGTALSGLAYDIEIQSDGKILIVGSFTTFNGATVNRIVRLNSDGTRDTTFTTNTGTGASDYVKSIVVQPDGKILVGGGFATFNGVTVNRIVRLNSNGTRDTAFSANTGTGLDGGVSSMAIQADGKIVIAGIFSTFNGTTIFSVFRLNSNGTLDTGFVTPSHIGNSWYSVLIQSDGKILLGGEYNTFNNITINYLVRLNSNGTMDTAFTANDGAGADFFASTMAIQSDGKIVVGGYFGDFNNTYVGRIIRIGGEIAQ
jgi:uncharacterized delta-60 repeat protein